VIVDCCDTTHLDFRAEARARISARLALVEPQVKQCREFLGVMVPNDHDKQVFGSVTWRARDAVRALRAAHAESVCLGPSGNNPFCNPSCEVNPFGGGCPVSG
jgi:hypothetical protein